MTEGTLQLLAAGGSELVALMIGAHGGLARTCTVRVDEPIQHGAATGCCTRIYLACSDGGIGRRGTRHALEMVQADAQGRWRRAGTLALPQRPVHVAVDAANARIHLAFNVPSAYASVALDAHGAPAAIEHHVHGPDRAGWFAHQALPIASSGCTLLVCRGDDATDSAPENPGSLRVLKDVGGDVRVLQQIAPGRGFGFGPRNGAFSPNGRFLYLVLERQNRLAVFPCDRDELASTPSWEVSTLALRPSQATHQLAGDICLHPSGRFAYVLNRSRDVAGENSVVTMSIDPATGQPVCIDTLLLPGSHPRTVRMSADGAWMAIAVMEADTLRAHRPGVSLLAVNAEGRLVHRHHWMPTAHPQPMMWATLCQRPT
ncbi:lactonase family protein [Hydrogenophaga sp.]|uniref:lactonase family protein n=1 Tax=Hydrogenophaga sp. TaxID=1904254 RepID=UPI003F7259D4